MQTNLKKKQQPIRVHSVHPVIEILLFYFVVEYNEKTGGNLALFDDPFLLMINSDDEQVL